MEAQIGWLDNPEVFRVNQIPAHSDHKFYQSEKDCMEGNNRLCQSLNGTWKFRYSKNAMTRPVDFYKKDYDTAGFDEIAVPGHIELAGYDRIHYINIMYPWEGHEYRRPAGSEAAQGQRENLFSGAEYNPVGSYVCHFDLQEELRGKRVVICFEGVEQAVYVWLNGTFIGYAEDSFTPSEFDLSSVIQDKDNVLAVEVHKRSSAAFLEDQDFFRFFGIFRDVKLYAKPEIHVEDLWIRPRADSQGEKAEISVRLKLSGSCDKGSVEVLLRDGDEVLVRENRKTSKEMEIKKQIAGSVRLWEHRTPFLYRVEVRLYNEEGKLAEIVPYDIGFRTVEIRDKIICLNGRRLVLTGVNRHEWSARTGRCIGMEEMKWDMECIRRNHINAVRTCHYPDQIPWYYMCDREGIYMMAETNLETHGSWGKYGTLDSSWNVPGDFPQWEAVTIDRARTNFETFKNHPSILFWSLGNESYAGTVLEKMNQCYKEWDSDRIVHYEGVFFNRAYEDKISDVESRMYAYPENIREYLENNPKKPFILCEYMHDMGNSMGGLNTYMKLLDEYPMYQGGFIWDFIDQALFVKDEVTGREVLRYGGDFDDRPADYEFSGDGILFADRTEKPAMQEVRHYYGIYEQ
jgi:beta-galactosidase